VQRGRDDEGRRDLAAQRPAERSKNGIHAAGSAGLVSRDGLDDQVAESGIRQADPDSQQP
jgi:hypothetical protein